MRFKISVNFIGEFRVAEVIATPLVGIFKKKNVIFGEFKGNNPTHIPGQMARNWSWDAAHF